MNTARWAAVIAIKTKIEAQNIPKFNGIRSRQRYAVAPTRNEHTKMKPEKGFPGCSRSWPARVESCGTQNGAIAFMIVNDITKDKMVDLLYIAPVAINIVMPI